MKDNQASVTAFSVAAHLLLLAKDRKFGQLISDDAVQPLEWFLEEAKLGKVTLKRMQAPWFRPIYKLIELLTLPGLTLHLAVRKNWIEQQVKTALSQGVKQIVVLGAGFDPLVYRYHQSHPQVTFIEVDHPATQEAKKRALTQKTSLGKNIHFLALDLKNGSLLEKLLEETVFDRSQPTLFIAEGLLMYLEEEHVKQTLKSMAQLGHQPRIIGTVLQPMEDGRLGVGKSRFLDPARLNEPLLWGIPQSELPQFLQEQSWKIDQVQQTKEVFQSRFPDQSQRKLPVYEYLFAASAHSE
jgi:methyltransferase (TIGR00027 family)